MPCAPGLTPAQALLLPPLHLIAQPAVLLQVPIRPAPATMAPKMIRSASKPTRPPSRLSRWRATLLSGYYLTNVLLMLAYIPVRVHFLLNMVPQQHDDDDYEDPQPDSSSMAYTRLHSLEELLKWEMQLFGMVALISFMKTVRGELIARAFVADLFMYAKAAVLTLIWMVDWRLGSWYGLLCLISWLGLTMPHYTGPHSFQDMSPAELEDAIRAVKGTNKLLVLFYSPTSTRCLYLEPQLAQASLQFTSPSVKFARIDASAWPVLAEQHNVSLAPAREQLPSLLLFEQGAEAKRLPALNLESGVVYRASFRPRKIASAFNL